MYNEAMMKWVARFSFSFLAVGGLLFYEVYDLSAKPGTPAWQYALLLIGGAMAISLGARGIRERHRRDDPE